MASSPSDGRWGGCVLATPLNNETVELADTSLTILQDSEYAPFVKKMQTYGTLFVGMEGVSDDFMKDVAYTLHQMFPQDSSLDLAKQGEVLNAMHQYYGAIPVFNGDNTDVDVDKLAQDCSVCDIIMYRVHGQVMEVVEHLLHHITNLGLHYAFPAEWAFNDSSSEVYQVMNQAIEEGWYEIQSYEEIRQESCDVYNRVLVQEFAYWLITTYWNLQEPYGPNENEWTIRNKQQLQEKLPVAHDLVAGTVGRIMAPPSSEMLETLKTYEP
ncbi:MAG: hypothetical protein AAF587_24930 [Bacteroidota bacterium]